MQSSPESNDSSRRTLDFQVLAIMFRSEEAKNCWEVIMFDLDHLQGYAHCGRQ